MAAVAPARTPVWQFGEDVRLCSAPRDGLMLGRVL